VIADTEPWQGAAYRTILERRGFHPTPDFFNTLTGKTEADIWEALKTQFPLRDNEAALRRERVKVVLNALLSEVPPNWFVRPALDHFDRLSTPSVLVSAGNSEVIEPYLAHWGLATRFALTSTGPEPGAPDVAAKPERIQSALASAPRPILFEDSAHYLRVGRVNSACTVAVIHGINVDEAFDADALLDSATG
jgi:beta-phosphoglucomutase-like phosphatase (HAD superfamily)